MTKQKEKQIDEVSNIRQLVTRLNAKAFEFCRDEVFDLFDYKFMEKNEFRPVDFCEQISVLALECGDVVKLGGCVKYYATLLEQRIEDYCKCSDGSRARKYKDKALSLLAKDQDDELDLDAISDATMIFLSLFKEYYSDGKIKKDSIEDADFTEHPQDIELLKTIYNGVKGNSGVKLKISRQSMTDERKKFFYVIGVVILAIGLQDRGLL